MDSSLKKTDITKKIAETRKQTEELKAQLQQLIDSGINSSVDYKTSTHSHADKENFKESQNKVQIIKSYDTAHSQHVTKPGTSRGNLSEKNKDTESKDQENVCKRTKNYDVSRTREYIKKQREKRLEEQKLKNEEKKKAELRKQKLEELRKKSLELVTKNVQTKRERSKSRERTDFVRPVKDVAQEKGRDKSETRNRKNSMSEHRINNFPQDKIDSVNPNLLHPPVPNYMLHMRSEKKSGSSRKKSPVTHDKITIISGNSSDRKRETPESNRKSNLKSLQPKNLFDSPKDSKEKPVKPSSDLGQNFLPVRNLLEYKNNQNNNNRDINLHLTTNKNLVPTVFHNVEKPKLSEIGIGTDNLEKITKETQTKDESNHDFPSFLNKKIFEPDPLNFINCVKLKLQNAIHAPTGVDVGIQSSFAQENFKPGSLVNNKNKEVKETLHNNTRSSKKSDLKSFISHRGFNLDQKTIDNIELIPKNFRNENSDTESDSDTSKNIPEISSESATSLKKNAESIHNYSIGLDVEKLNSMKLKAQNVHKDTHTVEKPKNHSSTTNGESLATKLDVPHSKTETIRSSSNKLHTGDRYTSDFYSKSQSVTHRSSRPSKMNLSNKNTDYEIITDPQIRLYSEKHSSNIPQTTEKHSRNISPSMSINSENENHISSRNITVRSVSHNGDLKSYSSIKESIDGVSDSSRSKKALLHIPSESETQTNRNRSEKLRSESKITVRSSEKSDKYMSLFSDFHPSTPITETLSKSDSNLQNINTSRGFGRLSDSKFVDVPSLKEPTLSLIVSNGNIKEKSNKKEDKNKLLSNISFRSDRSKYSNMNKANEIHLKFEAEVHLLNDFNESLRHFSEVEKAFNTLKSQNDTLATTNKVLQNQDTQTSIVTKSSTPTTESKTTDDCISDEKSELSSINFSQDFLVDVDSSSLDIGKTVSRLDDTSNVEDLLNRSISNNLSNFENLQSNNFAGMTLRMFEQLIKDEDVRLENLKTILKIREQALLDRTKGELAWLEIQRKHLRETGKLHEASLIKKKQRGILVNHQKERHEMQRLKQMQKAASTERKIILKEQRNLIKHQLSTDKMLSKIKVNGPRERRLSGPLKVIQSQAESIKSEASFSRRSSSDRERETFSISHTQSIVSIVSEVTDEASRREALPRPDLTDLTVRLPSEAAGVPISQIKKTLLIREAALQKRRKAAEELLQWHRKLLEEEKRITELESITNTIISQIPGKHAGGAEKYHFGGKQLNQLWYNLTGRDEKKFNENKTYPMSQMALERFCKSAREYSAKTRSLKRGSDSEISERSDFVTENVPTEHSSNKNETGTNEYTSDFDIDSLCDIVNAGEMYVVDESINQLIDNFSRIQDDISSLGKQSLKPGVEEESVKSENTDSEVDVSVIETARTSKGTEDLRSRKSDRKKHGNEAKSKSETIMSLQSVLEQKMEDGNGTSDDKISSIIEENVLGVEDNLNKSQEILEELNCVDYQTGKDVSFDREAVAEDVQIISEGKANLSRSEEILQRLSLTDKDSINFDKNSLQSGSKTSLDNESNKSESIVLQLRPIEDKSVVEASTSPVLSEDLKDTNSIDIKTAEEANVIEESPLIEEVSKNEEDSLVHEEILVPSSEIVSEKPLEIEEVIEEAKEEPILKSAINSTSEVSNEALSAVEDNSVVSIDLKNEEESKSVSTDSVLPSKSSSSEGETDLPHEDQVEINQITDSPKEEISEKISKSREDTDEKPNSDQISLKEKDSESKIASGKDSVSDTNKVVEDHDEISSQKDTKEESLTSNHAPTITEDKTSHDENTEAKSVVSENISSAKSDVEENQLQTIRSDKSVSENQATILSKEDINSYEEKELDSLSSSTTASQTSVVNDKEESHSEEIKSQTSEEKSPKSETVDVKKRVSEIMADATQASRGDKSPKLQDFYTTTYDLVSPANSPELGSPVEEQKFVSAKSIFGTEAEEILRKQLAIEQEIKQITEQQQKEQIPYLYVREIPNKPPPPYTPPSSAPVTNVVTIIPTSEEIEEITKYSAKILHKAYLSNNLDNVSISDNTLSLISKDITKECYKFVFDLCKDISKAHYKQFEQEDCVAWLKERKNSRLAIQKPLDVNGLEKHMTKKLKELFGYEKPMRRENTIIKWSQKKRDHVDEILVMESQAEESQWTNYEKDELLVMNDVTNEIMNMLLKETTDVFSKILSKQTF